MKSIKVFAIQTLWVLLGVLCACDKGTEQPEDPIITDPEPEEIKITVDPAVLKQEMIGFGGALTWYANWVTNNNQLDEIADLMFTDLGIDIIRFKTWYYPINYPENKTTNDMPDDNAKAHWDATNILYNLAKARNPDVKILLSSWGPPRALKSNGQLPEGTLKRNEAGAFMYDEFAQYWVDILDHTPFHADYISIQNEPTYVNSGWTTCRWGATESPTLPGYNIAFDKVFDRIKDRDHVPLMLGPESQDISTFVSFANVLKTNPNCALYGYHPYNINGNTGSSTVTSELQRVGAFKDKLNLMTEFSDNLNWYQTAIFIQKTLVEANTSGYIYWKLAWNTPSSGEDAAMISVASASAGAAYQITPYYHLIKHFSKHVDAGYHRVETTASLATLLVTGFLNPAGNQLTVIAINDGAQVEVQLDVKSRTVSAYAGVQSKQNSYYGEVAVDAESGKVTLPGKSITTLILDM